VQQISQMMDGVPPDWKTRSILAQLLELQRQAEITALIARADEPESITTAAWS
jgi:hypothetical protein